GKKRKQRKKWKKPEKKKVEIETKETPAPQPTLAESQIQMAAAFGQMTESNRKLMEKVDREKSERQILSAMMSETLAEMRALRSQQDTTSRQTEQLQESQTAIISAAMENSENEDKSVIPVTPMETHIEIDQKPANTKRSLFQKIFF